LILPQFPFVPHHTPAYEKGPDENPSRRARFSLEVKWGSYCCGVVVDGVVLVPVPLVDPVPVVLPVEPVPLLEPDP